MNPSLFRKEEIIKPDGAVSFVIVSYNVDDLYYKLKESLKKSFSEILFESNLIPGWTPSQAEIGYYPPGSKSRILSFKRRINREELPEMKERSIQIVNSFSKQDPSIKIMPGYQTLFNTILSSITDDFHKIYLFHGIYGEVVYKYERRELQVTEFAPSYFSHKEVIYYFTNLREYYNQSLQIK